MRTLLLKAITALTIPIILVIRALKPFVFIRFGCLQSERLGHFAANTELYMCERDQGMTKKRTFDIFYCINPVCNQQLKKMWSRTLCISSIARLLSRANRYLPGYMDYEVSMPLKGDSDIHDILVRTKTHLFFTSKEEKMGVDGLHKLGISKDAPFICFYSRDPAYLKTIFPQENWDCHDYRDSDIYNFIPAAEELTKRGYYMVRMGAIVKEALNTVNPKIIDYAKNGRSDFLDIYLAARCHFFLGSTAGLNAIPRIFRRPIAYVDVIPIGTMHFRSCAPKSLFITKKLWLRKDKRFLKFREIVDLGANNFYTSEAYERSGIEVIGNTAEEIAALSIEMDERLNGRWQTKKEDAELQNRFWSIFDVEILHTISGVCIGSEFLRQNRELLE